MTRKINSDTLSESRALLEVLFEESKSIVAFTGAGHFNGMRCAGFPFAQFTMDAQQAD